MKAQDAHQTLYLFDVRTPEEYAAGHIIGSRSAPGGQLVQSTDFYVGTRCSQIVLCDDNGVRAYLTASWLLQMGWRNVFVIKGGIATFAIALETGPERVIPLGLDQAQVVNLVPVWQLREMLAAGHTRVIDLTNSRQYKQGHIPGAWFAVRARLAQSLAKIPPHSQLVLTSDDGLFAQRVAPEVSALTPLPVLTLAGGTAAWVAAGLALTTGYEHMADAPDDIWHSPYDMDDPHPGIQDYLCWETDLLNQIENEHGLNFKYFAPVNS